MKKVTFLFSFLMIISFALSAGGSQESEQNKIDERVGEGYLYKYEPAITLTGNRIARSEVDFINNPYTKWASETLGINYELKWLAPDADTERQKLTLAMASNDLPDIVSIEAGDLFSRMVNSGILLPLDDLIEEYGSPLTKAMIKMYQDALDDNFFSLFTVDGKIYAFPEASDIFAANWKTLWMRQDILDEMNLDAPETIAEFETVLEKYKNTYPDGVGFISNAGDSNGMIPIMEAYGAFQYKWIKDSAGNLAYGSIQPEMKNALETLSRWYQLGYFDKEYFIKDDTKNREPLLAGNGLSVYGNWWYVLWPFPDMWTNVPTAEMTPLLPLIGPDGQQSIMHDISNGYFNSGRAISSSCKNPEALIYLLNEELDSHFRYNKELREQMAALGYDFKYGYEEWTSPVNPDADPKDQKWNYKIEGPDKFWNTFVENPVHLSFGFKYNEGPFDLFSRYVVTGEAYRNDNLESLSKPDYIDYEKYFSTPSNKMNAHVKNVENYDFIKNSDIIIFNEFTTVPTDTMIDKRAYLDKIEEEYFTKIITGALPLSSFDTFIEEWNKAGGSQITTEVNEWNNSK
ncbi:MULTISPECIES: extracellular solute-binding protein [unclassified Oceanispirochaeta]|uniref:extracellular solute-binding protein n=1 Tax=unclassified Oceanispirochaeta TaxID=2635722 RepID=UPI000E08E0ED|nr:MULTISPECIES: extracellular solute-binding protein [unclassified Oceanispirochaeta]MBF9014644.1 extracellular solute-binding protein [Oceanispirochaeta sp. M2]NPD70900.1 extracellular solute-binding protein [Oceanispirochaeta sp. M1]RDG33734.1 extracellular solute-binding protein [Oceanispirochaeta sp. M1]